MENKEKSQLDYVANNLISQILLTLQPYNINDIVKKHIKKKVWEAIDNIKILTRPEAPKEKKPFVRRKLQVFNVEKDNRVSSGFIIN